MIETPVFVAAAALTSMASAVTVPFTETFSGDAANWRDAAGTATLGWSTTGGPDGSGHATAPVNFAALGAGAQPLFAQARSSFGSSGGALFGDWLAAGVTAVSVDVRHDAGAPVSFYSRYTPGGAGAIVLSFTPVQPNAWTTLTFPISPAYPGFIAEGVSFADTFSNVQRVQFGFTVPGALGNADQTVTFAIDNVRLIPGPGAAALLGLAGLGVARRRRC